MGDFLEQYILAKFFSLSLALHLAAPDHTDVGRRPRAEESTDWAACVMEREESRGEGGREKTKGYLNLTLHLSGWEKWDHWQKKKKKKIDELPALVRTQQEYCECRVMCFTGSLLLGNTPDSMITLKGLMQADTGNQSSKSKGGALAVSV